MYIFNYSVLVLLEIGFIKTMIKIVNKGLNFPGQCSVYQLLYIHLKPVSSQFLTSFNTSQSSTEILPPLTSILTLPTANPSNFVKVGRMIVLLLCAQSVSC